jgi:hypothetical protein
MSTEKGRRRRARSIEIEWVSTTPVRRPDLQVPSDAATAARAAARQYTDWVLGFPNVTGCGIGRRIVAGQETNDWSLVVFVTRKVPLSALRSHEIIPRELIADDGTVLTDVVEVPEPEFHVDTARYRPLVGGCQIVTAAGGGTLGAILYDALDHQPVLLTCNHVVTLAGQRGVIPTDARVFQPEPRPALGRTRLAPAVPVGQTKRIVPWTLAPLGADYAWEAWVDAAIINPDLNVDVAFNVIDLGKHPFVVLPPYEGLEVVKRGATTQRTEGVVKYIDVKIVLKDSQNGQRFKIGGVDSGFAIRRLGGVFSARGDSGSLVVDKDLGAARGVVFGGDSTQSGWSYACELGAILTALQLETPCTGSLHSMIQRAVRRRITGASTSFEGRSAFSYMVGKMDRFRGKYLPETPDGRVAGALGAMFQALAVDLAEAINEDEDFAGVLDEAFGDWLIQPTIYDMLEYRLPDDFGQRVLGAFERLEARRPEVKSHTSWLRPAFSTCGGRRMRELLDTPSPAIEKREERKKGRRIGSVRKAPVLAGRST